MNLKDLLRRPEFYDIFGVPIWIFLIVLTIWSLKTGLPMPTWTIIVLLFIGILGLIVDGGMVFAKFLRKGNR
ncbi:MAG: hypothetical protein PHS53_03965 [Candidatus Pacebacteria bacterium]|nr:hypothetical protein [Candidatus Paceibacterota bacterium]MDD5357274.1 hypothetical protein [Candidatus Paceibacterota bacterium]